MTYTPHRFSGPWSSAPFLRSVSDRRSPRSQQKWPGWCSTAVRGAWNQHLCSWTKCNRHLDQLPSCSRPGVRSRLQWPAWMDLLQPWPHWRSLEKSERGNVFIYNNVGFFFLNTIKQNPLKLQQQTPESASAWFPVCMFSIVGRCECSVVSFLWWQLCGNCCYGVRLKTDGD